MATVLEIFTDGSCIGNPGPGGYAAIMCWNGREHIVVGNEVHTTNNRMEMMAAIAALRALKTPTAAVICSDSQYLVNGMTSWIKGWKARNWIKQGKESKEVPNRDLWEELDKLSQGHKLFWEWVRGHSGHVMNERCDKLATLESRKASEALKQAFYAGATLA